MAQGYKSSLISYKIYSAVSQVAQQSMYHFETDKESVRPPVHPSIQVHQVPCCTMSMSNPLRRTCTMKNISEKCSCSIMFQQCYSGASFIRLRSTAYLWSAGCWDNCVCCLNTICIKRWMTDTLCLSHPCDISWILQFMYAVLRSYYECLQQVLYSAILSVCNVIL